MSDAEQIEDARMCSRCKSTKPAVAFGTKGNGTRTKTCLVCMDRTRSAKQRQKDSGNNENADPDADAEGEDAGHGLGILSLHDFLDALTQEDNNLKLEARINISSISGSRRQRADALAASIWSNMKYRFVYQSQYDHKRTESPRYIYHCAQNAKRQHAPKKTQRKAAKPRDKIAMDAFPRSEPDPKTGKKPLYSVEPIRLTGEPGFTAIAFTLPQLLREVGGRVRELSLDSAWDTNGPHYEVYALLGEVYGSGMPLGYLLLQSSPNGAAGGKERFIRQLLRHFRQVWKTKIDPKSTHSWLNTPTPNINYASGMHSVLSKNGLQFCVEGQHTIMSGSPILNLVGQTRPLFPFLKRKSLLRSIPGIPVSTAPKEPSQAPSLTLRLNGVVRVVVPRQQRAENDGEAQPQADQPPTEGTDANADPGDLIADVERFLDNDNEEEEEDGPDWMFKEGEKRSGDPNYVFCRVFGLKLSGGESSAYMETIDGSITDGDDHGRSGNPEMLEGGGGWRNLNFTTPSLLGKRARLPEADSDDTEDMEETQCALFPFFEAQDSDDEEEVEEYAQKLLQRADEFQRAAEILRAQVPHRKRLWMSSIVKRDIGHDVSLMVADINRYEFTAQTRDNTWAKKGDREGQRRSQNTMGYQVDL
ncbi:hypothetical protein DFH09DRAFT_1082448 [Mycena vulgaris]|nr:hypothetical protein DFH09DRAFT_1082448 [Mycena vulgaris]